MQIAEVYVNIPVKSIAKSFTYILPLELHYVSIGWRVLVPFGGQQVEGFVVSVVNVPDDYELVDDTGTKIILKNICSTLDEESWFTPNSLKLAQWIAKFYLCSPAEIMRLFMPGKSGVKLSLCYRAIAGKEDHMLLLVDDYKRIYAELSAEECSLRQLKRRYPDLSDSMDNILEKLLRYNLVEKDYTSANKASIKMERVVQLTAYPDEEQLRSLKNARVQARLIGYMASNAGKDKAVPIRQLKAEGFTTQVVNNLVEKGWLVLSEQRVLRDSYRDVSVPEQRKKTLTVAQQQAVVAITADVDRNIEGTEEKDKKPFLLHGVTGSGKTLVYMEVARYTRSKDKKVLVLVPEIALTGQLVKNFKEYFSGDIAVIHSGLSLAERNDAVQRIRKNEANVIIGARSALFVPVDDIGIIIIDEEQDNSYKQGEAPRYHARTIAEHMAKFYGATLVLGSATPSMETYYRAKIGEYQYLAMPQRVGNKPLPQVISVDMRQELRQGRRTVLSAPLQELISATVAKKEQIILMLNRRGFNTFVMCRSCGYVVACKDCGLPMTFHKDGRLLCHHCDIQAPVPTECPKCKSRYIRYFGSGTEKLEAELETLVPHARSIRMDRDTTATKMGHANILNTFRNHNYDVLLGTQMVAKGHDIPNVTAVGVISADSSLHIPYFRAAEQVFMLITQTAGRAGRGDVPGKVVVQSYNPEHYAVTCGVAQDYEGFFKREIQSRRELGYPPFCRIVKLIFQDKKEQRALERARQFKNKLMVEFANSGRTNTLGPAPAMISNFKGIYRMCLIIKTSDLDEVQAFLRQEKLHLDDRVIIDIDPISTT